ncbi:MAG: serine protease [Bacteroidales bacterium]|nr:serine protease [Bacteroidales bacterium]MCM1415470.1 serine protease [bacterium]MCM1423407.1 serine protease [bacterium]
MRQFGRKHKISYVILWCGIAVLLPMQVRAQEPSLPPHLIQTVSAQDIYEGMLALELCTCPVLPEADPVAAYENVKNSVVRLDMGNAYGSGVIFRQTPDAVIIATNRHVLEYWNETSGVVWFPQGYFADAVWLGSSSESDVGFLRVDNGELGADALMTLRSVCVEEAPFAGGEERIEGFCVGTDRKEQEPIFQEAALEKEERYIELFQDTMLYGHGFAKEGMSGGGIFDGHGKLIGLLAGGTCQNEIAGVSAEKVEAAYREILAK